MDEKDRELLLFDAIQQVREAGKSLNMKPKRLLEQIISAKQNILDPNEWLSHIGDPMEKIFHAVYQSYQELLEIQELCDYEDLIFKTVRLLETKDRVAASYKNLFRYIFVDEYQDLNYGQYRIIKALVPPGIGKKICVVGDPNQSIYGFRGSSAKYFKRFVQDYPDAQIVKLTQNYRSTKTILDGSYQVIQSQGEKSFKERIYSEIDGTKTIGVIKADSEKAEAVAIGKTIEKMMGGTGFHSIDFGCVNGQPLHNGLGFSDFAVLYRTSEQSKILSQIFDTAGIPYQIVSRDNILNYKGIADVVSLLKIIEETGNFADFNRSLKITASSINKKSMEIFKTWCVKKRFSLKSALLNARRFPIREKKTKDAIKHLIDLYTHSDVDTKDFLKTCALQTDTDMYRNQSERVALMTMHASKGLECPIVFICGCENGLLPFQAKDADTPNTEEERRLFYVAMTRAQHRLFITYSKKRKRFGKIEKQTLSPFVREIEKDLITQETSEVPKNNRTGQRQLKLF
ncbi:MAG: ATP-dependent helicase [Desulfobacterales bacterium]